MESEIWALVSRALVGWEAQEDLTASMTAPVEGSWGLPAWTARVPKLCTGEGALGGVSIEPLVPLVVIEGDIMLCCLESKEYCCSEYGDYAQGSSLIPNMCQN